MAPSTGSMNSKALGLAFKIELVANPVADVHGPEFSQR
jgi:hypothetical protein